MDSRIDRILELYPAERRHEFRHSTFTFAAELDSKQTREHIRRKLNRAYGLE